MPDKFTTPETWYVYTYAYHDGTVFYVGKGKRGRIDEHEREARKGCTCEKCRAIRRIRDSGHPVRKRIVFETQVETETLAQECLLIKQYAGPQLTNVLWPTHGCLGEVILRHTGTLAYIDQSMTKRTSQIFLP